MYLMTRSQLKNVLSIDPLPSRIQDAFNVASGKSYKPLHVLKELILPSYKGTYKQEDLPEQVLRGSFHERSFQSDRNAIFYDTGNYYDKFSTAIGIGETYELIEESGTRNVHSSYINVYIQPIFPGIYDVSIAPGALGLKTPFDNDVIKKSLDVIGTAIGSINAGAPMTIHELRARLVDAGIKEYRADIPYDRTLSAPALTQ